MMAVSGSHAAGVGAVGGGAAGGGGGGTDPTGDRGSHAAGGGAAGGSPQSNENSPWGSDGPPAGVAAPVIAPAGALPAESFGHALNALAEARDEEEHERLRHDLAEHVWVDMKHASCALRGSIKGFLFSLLRRVSFSFDNVARRASFWGAADRVDVFM